MTFREAALEELGERAVSALERTAGCHSRQYGTKPPDDPDARLIFAMLEAIDWSCDTNDWGCPGRENFYRDLKGLMAADMKKLLQANRDRLVELASLIPLPSALGLVAGHYDDVLFPEESADECAGGV